MLTILVWSPHGLANTKPPFPPNCNSTLSGPLHTWAQEPWPCNGEDPWHSSKNRIMSVGKAVLCSHGTSSILWSGMDHVEGPSHVLLGETEGRNWFEIICLKHYQFERITWWCFLVLESIQEYVMESTLQSFLNPIMLEKYIKKSWSPIICVSPTSWRWTWQKF